jgi:hypothetical protein
MNDSLKLLPLNPETDLELFKVAYNWRTKKRRISGPQMSFEAFSEINPTHLTVGLFNGELLAVYFLREWEPAKYEAHFTSKRGVSRETLLWGAKTILDLMLVNGAAEVVALIVPQNRALRRFVTQIGMGRESVCLFSCTDELNVCSIAPRNQRMFIKYAKRA